MNEYERRIQERERRINVMRLTRALWEYINGEYAGIENSHVQNLARALHYMPEQLIQDIRDTYRYCTDKVYEDKERAAELDDD